MPFCGKSDRNSTDHQSETDNAPLRCETYKTFPSLLIILERNIRRPVAIKAINFPFVSLHRKWRFMTHRHTHGYTQLPIVLPQHRKFVIKAIKI